MPLSVACRLDARCAGAGVGVSRVHDSLGRARPGSRTPRSDRARAAAAHLGEDGGGGLGRGRRRRKVHPGGGGGGVELCAERAPAWPGRRSDRTAPARALRLLLLLTLGCVAAAAAGEPSPAHCALGLALSGLGRRRRPRPRHIAPFFSAAAIALAAALGGGALCGRIAARRWTTASCGPQPIAAPWPGRAPSRPRAGRAPATRARGCGSCTRSPGRCSAVITLRRLPRHGRYAPASMLGHARRPPPPGDRPRAAERRWTEPRRRLGGGGGGGGAEREGGAACSGVGGGLSRLRRARRRRVAAGRLGCGGGLDGDTGGREDRRLWRCGDLDERGAQHGRRTLMNGGTHRGRRRRRWRRDRRVLGHAA